MPGVGETITLAVRIQFRCARSLSLRPGRGPHPDPPDKLPAPKLYSSTKPRIAGSPLSLAEVITETIPRDNSRVQQDSGRPNLPILSAERSTLTLDARCGQSKCVIHARPGCSPMAGITRYSTHPASIKPLPPSTLNTLLTAIRFSSPSIQPNDLHSPGRRR